MLGSTLMRVLVAVVTLGVCAMTPGAWAQATYLTQLRSVAVSAPLGSDSASTPAGDFSPFNASVTAGVSPGTNSLSIQSALASDAISLSGAFNCQTAGLLGSPSATLQHQVQFTLAEPATVLLLASDGLPGTPNVQVNTLLGDSMGTIYFDGRSTAATGVTINLPAGSFTFSTFAQVSVAGGANGPAVGSVSVSISFLPLIDSPTSILYQGRLDEGGLPANGQRDMTFQVFDRPTGGTPLTPVVSVPRVDVVNGLFTTPVPISANVWNSGRAYLEIAVGFPITIPTVLSPRQPIQPAPKANWAARADEAVQASTVPWSGIANVPANVLNAFSPWQPSGGGIIYTGGGNVGIGLTGPSVPLHVRVSPSGVNPNPGTVLALESGGSSYINLLHANGTESGILFGRPMVGSAGAGIVYNNLGNLGGLQFRTDTNVNRLTIASSGDATFTNNVTASNFSYASPVQSFVMYTDAAVRSRNGAPVRGVVLGGGGASLDTGTNDSLAVQLNLPHGALFTGVRVYFTDAVTSNLSINVFSYSPTAAGYSVLGSATPTGAIAGTRIVDIPVSALIDNANNSYVVTFAASGNWDGGLSIRGVRATYTLSRPVP